MAPDARRVEHLFQLREEIFQEMEAAEREFSRVRLEVERMESDLRLGRPEAAGYTQAKGRLLPQAEARVIELYGELLKIEDKIRAAG